ncbi:MAG: single-stranded-DNA-specific exonuclease RecJ, partial [Bacillota bacterium]
AKILLQRGIDTPEKVREFLDPESYQPKDPFSFPDMEESVDFILQAAKNKRKICVYGDYDVDGVTSTVILVELLRSLGCQVIYHIPDRFTEGYGMNKEVIRKLAREIDIIVSCDCGISNHEEIKLAKELGLEVLITDHHNLPEELPQADYILSPKLLDKDDPAYHIPGAGMAYFLTAAVLKRLNREGEINYYLDLLALAIVADVVPLQQENRYLLQKGLPVLADTSRTGLKELLDISVVNRDELSEEDIAYRLAPRINSAGRLENAKIVVELFLSRSEEIAKNLVQKIEDINNKRKEIQDRLIKEAEEMFLSESSQDIEREGLVLYHPDWHQGVIGIAAGRLADNYNLPAILITQKEDGITLTGSARSIPGIDIYQELKKCDRYLDKFGGHAGAAGFSLHKDNLTAFKKLLKTLLSESLAEITAVKKIQVDACLSLDEISLDTYYNLRKLAPFGEMNPQPLFISKDLDLLFKRPTFANKHLRLTVAQNKSQLPAIWWWAGDKEIAKKLDLIYSLGINDYQGKREVQLLVEEAIDNTSIGIGESKAEYQVPGEKVVKKAKGINSLQIYDFRKKSNEMDKMLYFIGKEINKLSNNYYYDKIYIYSEGFAEEDEISIKRNLQKIFKDEGYMGNNSPHIEFINRYKASQANILIFLSLPPSLDILRELFYTISPLYIMLAFPEIKLRNINNFLQELAGISKYIINKKNGILNVFQLASKIAVTESTVFQGLKVLETGGLINIDNIKGDTLLLKRGKGLKQSYLSLEKKRLEKLIREANSFTRYISSLEKNDFYTVFN